MFSFQIFVGSRRELVANSVHTADADATPTQLNSTVESRRRCVLGRNNFKYRNTNADHNLVTEIGELSLSPVLSVTLFPCNGWASCI